MFAHKKQQPMCKCLFKLEAKSFRAMNILIEGIYVVVLCLYSRTSLIRSCGIEIRVRVSIKQLYHFLQMPIRTFSQRFSSS